MILRRVMFSSIDVMIDKIENMLSQDKYEDFEVSDRLSKDSISIVPDPGAVKIYIPKSMEYSQFEIEDYIRVSMRFIRVSTVFDRGYYILSLSNHILPNQLYDLIRYIIDEGGFCTILDNQI